MEPRLHCLILMITSLSNYEQQRKDAVKAYTRLICDSNNAERSRYLGL